MKQCGLRKAFAGGGMLGYTPTAGESTMLKSLDERMGWGPEAAAAPAAAPAAPKINPAPIPGADDNGVLPGEWGYNQNGGSRKSTMLNNLLDDTRGGSKSGRRVAGAGVAALLRESPNLMSSEDLYEKIGSTRSASGRMGLGQAMTGQLMRGYAQGGTIDPEALMREMAAKYGTGGGQPQPAPAPQPAPQPAQVQAPAPKPTLLQGLHRLATGNLEGRMKAAGFKQGGTVDGKGYIHGEKGVDKVPAKIAESGEDILVSHGERIVNKKQNAALEKLAAAAGMGLDEYLEQSTGEPVGPSMKQGLRGLNKGGFVDDFGNLKRPQGFQAGDRAAVLSQQLAAAAPESQLSSAQVEEASRRAADARKMDGLRTIRPNATHIGPTPVAPISQAGFDFAHESPADSRALQARPRDLTDVAAARDIEARQAQAAKPSVQMNPVRGSAPGVMSAEAVQHLQDQTALDKRFAQAGQQPTAQPQAAQTRMSQPSRAPYGTPEPVVGPSPTPPGAEPTRWEKAKAGGAKWGGRANAAAQVLTGVHDIATANEPAEQAVGALKASGALPGLAGIPGKVAMYGDMALGMADTSIAKLLDKGLRIFPDYQLDKNREWGTAGTRAEAMQPSATQPAAAPSATSATPVSENFDPVDRRSAQALQAGGAVNDLELKGLRNAQQFLGGEGAVIPTGLRTARQIESNAPLTTWNSKYDVAAQAINNRTPQENGTGIMSVRQKDGSFKNVAIGQSEYVGADGKPTNDWSKTQQYADGVARAQRDKAELDQIQRQRANFDAFDPSITDPNARASGLRRVMMYASGDAAAAKAAQEKRAQDIQIRGQDITLRGQNNMQGNSDREFEHKTDEAHQKRLEGVLKAKATVDGKLNGEKYAWLQAYAGNFNSKHAKNSDAFFKDLADNLEVDSAFQADDGSLLRRVGSSGADAVRGVKTKDGLLWGENYIDPRTGREVSASDIAKMSPGAREVLKQRMAQQ